MNRRRLLARLARRIPPPALDLASLLASRASSSPSLVRPRADRVLAVTAHPDDETLAFGGTLRLLVDAGAQVRLVCATNGEASMVDLEPEEIGRRRADEVRAASHLLGVDDVVLLGLPDGQLAAHRPALDEAVAAAVRAWRPDLLLTLWPGDAHPDHRAVAEATAAAADVGAVDAEVWGGEIWTALPQNVVVDVTGVWNTKLAALAEHRTAALLSDTTAVLGLNRHRTSRILHGRGHAEAFVVATPTQFRELAETVAWARDRAGH